MCIEQFEERTVLSTYSITPDPATVTEGNQVTFTVARTGDKPLETVYFSARADGTATWSEGDFTTTSGERPLNMAVNFASGVTSETVTLNIVDDGQNDSGEQFRTIVQRSSSDPASTFLAQSDFVTINDAAQNTTYSLTPSVTTVTEGNQVTFTVARTGDKPLETVYFSARADGTQTVTITASAGEYVDGRDSLDVTDHDRLTVAIAAASMAENAGPAATTGTVTRSNTDNSAALTVTLTNGDDTEIAIPATVTIPANQASVSFDIDAVDDDLLDGTHSVTVTGSASGYVDGSDTLDVTDHETLTVTIDPASMSENGGTATGTVTRSNTDNGSALTVSLSSSDTSEAMVPATVTIPANEASANFTITAVDDALLDGTQTVAITASALLAEVDWLPGEVGPSQWTILPAQPRELQTIAFSGPTPVFGNGCEGAIAFGGWPTISVDSTSKSIELWFQPPAPDVCVMVWLPVSGLFGQFGPLQAGEWVFYGNHPSANFWLPFQVGEQEELMFSGNGYVNGIQTLDVTDHETLTLSIDPTSISENGGAATGTVTRLNTDISQAITVSLASDDTSEATVPATVEILAGEASATFAVTAVDDDLLDGMQTATITASHADYAVDGIATVEVTDYEDTDEDAVPEHIEDGAPNNGDGNGDGVLDSQQDNVASFPSSVDSTYVTLAASDGARLNNVTASSNPSPGDTPPDATFPIGFFAYEIADLGAGVPETVTIYWESNRTLNTYLKYGPTPDDPTPHWYSFMFDGTTGAEIFRDRIVLHLIDGLRGDDDLTANGVIVDPGAPATVDHPWRNPVVRQDVNNDSVVSALDVLMLVNEINRNGAHELPQTPSAGNVLPPFLDVTGDDHLTPSDVLAVINYVNGQVSGEGEAETGGPDATSPALTTVEGWQQSTAFPVSIIVRPTIGEDAPVQSGPAFSGNARRLDSSDGDPLARRGPETDGASPTGRFTLASHHTHPFSPFDDALLSDWADLLDVIARDVAAK